MTAKTPKEAKAPKAASYMVLGCDAGSRFWHELGMVETATQQEAKKDRAKAHPDYEAYVAIPARSWKPSKRTVTTVEKETWSS